MADLLTLTWASDGEVDQDTLNLLDFAQGFTLADNGWIPQVAAMGQSTITETLTFRAKSTSHDGLATRLQILDDWIVKCDWSRDPTQRQIVWLNARWKTETETRRAPVYDLSYSINSSHAGPFVRDDSFVPELIIVITRGAYWEELIGSSAGAGVIGTTGGQSVSALTVNGDVPARIQSFRIDFPPDAPSFFRYSWVGFRSSRSGDLSQFVSVWSLDLSVWLYNIMSGEAFDDTVIVADATAYNGNKIVTNFSGGATLLNRSRTRAGDVSPVNYNQQRGVFTCLLRAKMSGAGIARVRLSSGFAGAYKNPYFVNPRVPIQGTSWLLYDLGLLRLPAFQQKYETVNTIMEQAAAMLDAERVSGSSDLEMDCLILIPYNDGFIKVDVGENTDSHIIITNPDFGTVAYNNDNFAQSIVEPNGWTFPANNEQPLIVLASQNSSAHELNVDAALTINVIRRWRTLRGTE